jgi:hypothetical protein
MQEEPTITAEQEEPGVSGVPPDQMYRRRFPEGDHREKQALWRVLAPYLDRLIPAGPVLDIACDRGYFIANVARAERWATDLRDTAGDLPPEVRFVRANGLELAGVLPAGHFAGVFMSNYLEHLAASGEVLHVIPMDKPVDGEMVRASIIAAHGQLFIRTTRKLDCVGKGR